MHAAPDAHRNIPTSPLAAGAERLAADPRGHSTAQVTAMFDRIALRYDFLNRLLSAGTDRRWRRSAVNRLSAARPKTILDVAAGTGDMILECLRLRPERIVGIDPSSTMLAIARSKVDHARPAMPVELTVGTAEEMPFPAATFDALTCAFGVRNFARLDIGLEEFSRVLRPGGTVLILEFSRPEKIPAPRLYRFYFERVLPVVGGLVSGDRGAYQYLHDTVDEFPSGTEFLPLLRDAGFTDLRSEPLSYGIATIYTATKPDVVWS